MVQKWPLEQRKESLLRADKGVHRECLKRSVTYFFCFCPCVVVFINGFLQCKKGTSHEVLTVNREGGGSREGTNA